MLLKSLLQFILLSLNFILTMVISLSAPKCLDAWMYSCYLAFKHIFGSQIFYLTRRRHAFVFEKRSQRACILISCHDWVSMASGAKIIQYACFPISSEESMGLSGR